MKPTYIATSSAPYARQALQELRTYDPKIGSISSLAPGVMLFTPSLSRADFLSLVQGQRPIFIRHLHPVERSVGVDPVLVDSAAQSLLNGISPGQRVAVQVRVLGEQSEEGADRSELRERLDRLVAAAGGEPVTQGASMILSVSLAEGEALLGLSTPDENLSDWPGGEMRFRREEGQLSRAKFKLLEAFQIFGIEPAQGGSALDLGAAPGGWSSLLLERGLRVTAVDTGELAPTLVGNPNLIFLHNNAEEVSFPPASFDLLTCDMSWSPTRTARMVVKLAPTVRTGADTVLTVKLMGDNPTRTIKIVREIVSEAFEVRQVRQLFHNRDEVTMHLVRPAT